MNLKLAIFALSLGGFAIGTGEFVIMGLLSDAAKDLNVSIPDAGNLISMYALGVVIGAPLLAVLGSQLAKKNFLILLMLLFCIGNLLSSVLTSYGHLLFARFISGLPHGTFFGVASLAAADLVNKEKRTLVVSRVLLGLTVANVIGVPLASVLGQYYGWQDAFLLVSTCAFACALCLYFWLPYKPVHSQSHFLQELQALKNSQVLITLAIGSIGFGGLFAIFSYVKPTMLYVAKMDPLYMPIVLALFGAGMVCGNIFVGKFLSKDIDQSVSYVLLWSILVMTLFVFSSRLALLGALNIFLVGTVISLASLLQVKLMDVAGESQTMAAALNHSAFNIANALGAWLGGLSIDLGYGFESTGWVGAILAVLGYAIHRFAKSKDNRLISQPN